MESSDVLPGGGESGDSLVGEAPGEVGCDDSGPLPGVGGRGVSGGLSSGAGIEVPSVREKLMGASVSGLKENLDDMAAAAEVAGWSRWRVPNWNVGETIGLRESDTSTEEQESQEPRLGRSSGGVLVKRRRRQQGLLARSRDQRRARHERRGRWARRKA